MELEETDAEFHTTQSCNAAQSFNQNNHVEYNKVTETHMLLPVTTEEMQEMKLQYF